MEAERWKKIEDIVHAALALDVKDRPAFLDKVCAADSDLRHEIESLLAYEDPAGSFIETAAVQLAGKMLCDERSDHFIGSIVGHHRVISLLGAGGMGEVYLAEDTRLGRKAALKFLPSEFTRDRDRVRRFQREARAASALNHPNILTIYDIGQVDDTHYIATELIEGETLRQRLASGRMDIAHALDVTCEVAGALQAAHEAGIIHRDIKPENIMLRRDGYVKVLDFGLAKLVEEEPTEQGLSTETGLVFGTPRYMSPEQARGQKLDARSDLFSLGVILYEMLAGESPFAASASADVIAAILTKEPATLAKSSPAIPEAVQFVVNKALRKDREDRYQSARELLSDIKQVKHSLEVKDEQRSGGTVAIAQTARPTRRPWTKWAVVGGIVAVALAAVIWLYVLRPAPASRETATALKDATFEQLTFDQGPEYFPSLSPDGKLLIYTSGAPRHRDIYLKRVGGQNPQNLTKDEPSDDTQPTFSSDGERIAFRSERDGGGIYTMKATGESVTRVSDFGYNASWSPDSEAIAVATERVTQVPTRPNVSQLWTLNIKTGEKRLISEGDALQPSWSPHGHRIAYWSRPTGIGRGDDIWTIPVGGGEAVPVTSDAPTDWNPVWSPDGKYLYFSSTRGGSMNLWRVPINEVSGAVLGPPEPVTVPAASAQHISFSRDGKRLAYAAQELSRNLKKVAFNSSSGKVAGEPVWITRGSMPLWFPDVSPDGEWLTCSSMGNQRHVFVMRTDGSGQRDLTDDDHRYQWPRWSPDGKRIAFSSRRSGNNELELWIINRDGSGLRQLTETKSSFGAHYAPWSPDGKSIAYSIHTPKHDCVVFQPDKAWSDQTLEPIAALSDSTLSFEGWSWSPDGKKLAGIKHMPDNSHAGVGIYDFASKTYDWITDFGDWPIWLSDSRRLLFVGNGKIFLIDSQSKKYQPLLSVTDEDVDIGSPGLSPDYRTIYFAFVAVEADIWLVNMK